MSSAKVTTDHTEIQKWAEERGGKPAHVTRSSGEKDPGILRIDFPGYSGEDTLEQISWEDWFDAFEANKLAFLHQDETADGQVSRFNKLMARDAMQRREQGQQGTSSHKRK